MDSEVLMDYRRCGKTVQLPSCECLRDIEVLAGAVKFHDDFHAGIIKRIAVRCDNGRRRRSCFQAAALAIQRFPNKRNIYNPPVHCCKCVKLCEKFTGIVNKAQGREVGSDQIDGARQGNVCAARNPR